MNLKKKIGGTYGALLLITGLATAAQPMRYAYMDTDWYKTQGIFADQESERKRLLDTHSIGVYVTNPTPYPANVVLKKFSPGSTYPSLTKEKSIPEGATVEILGDALDQNYRYTVSGSLFKPSNKKTNQPLGMGFSTLQGPARIGVAGSAKPATVVTFSQRISTNKDWSLQSPTMKKKELVLELVEKQGAQPELRLRDK